MHVPVIDMEGYLSDTSHPSNHFVEHLGHALEKIGFATIVNHGIDLDLLDQAYSVTKRLFRFSDTHLKRYERLDLGCQRGFASFGTERAKDATHGDLKRFYHIGREGVPGFPRNVWPHAEVPEFRPVMLELYASLDRVSILLLNALDVYLGDPVGTLAAMVKKGNSLLRILHYPDVRPGWQGIRAEAHEDINFITLLVAATQSGLQVKPRGCDWFSVNEEPGSIVVNVSDMLQLLTRGRLVSTTHRVVNVSHGERFSMPFFIHPRSDVVLHEESGYTAGEYLSRRLIEIKVLEGDLSTHRPVPIFS